MSYYRIMIRGDPFRNMFELLRKWPKVLKCFIVGVKDQLMPEDLLCEKMAHYCYINKVEEGKERVLEELWKMRFGKECDNVQEEFVYDLEEGGHSIHIQKRYKDFLPQIINEYLSVIESQLSQEE